MAKSLFTLPFGRYCGRDIEDLPRSYLEWLTEQKWFRYRDRWGEPDK